MSILRPAARSLCASCRVVCTQRRYAALALAKSSGDADASAAPSPLDASAPATEPSTLKAAKTPAKRSPKRKSVPKDDNPVRDFSEPTNVERWLADLDAGNREPTLEDLERLRPMEPPSDPDSEDYPKEYGELVDAICRTFSRAQLQSFALAYRMDGRLCHSKRRKIEFAEAIVETQWDWPSLKEIEKQKRDRTEVQVKTFPLDARQLFLVMGKDGADLLQMSLAFNVHISLSKSPLALRVEGVRNSMGPISEHIRALKSTFEEKIFELPTNEALPETLMQRISRLSTAFVENADKAGRIRALAKNSESFATAERLATYAACVNQETSRTPLLSHIPATPPRTAPIPLSMFPNSYSLFPFLSPRPLPWTMNTSGAFRLRRLAEWLELESMEDIKTTGGLAQAKGKIVTVSERTVDLREALTKGIFSAELGEGVSRTITASMGHILFSSSNTGQRASLVPPLKGYWALRNLLRWIQKEKSAPTFVSSLPVPLIDSTPADQKIMHRLVYHALSSHLGEEKVGAALPVKVIKMEALLAEAKTKEREQTSSSALLSSPSQTNELSDAIKTTTESISGGDTSVVEASADADATTSATQDPTALYRCWIGSQSTLDLLMPDRPMDLRLTATESAPLTVGQMPSELRTYVNDLAAFFNDASQGMSRPVPPVELMQAGERYVLVSNQSVRQGTEEVEIRDKRSWTRDTLPPARVAVVSESILDLESRQRSITCEVACTDTVADDAWTGLLTDCDRLTSMTYQASGIGFSPGSLEGKADDLSLP